jgi:hypothetical protein
MYSHTILLFTLYTCELNFGQTIWGKTHVLLGTSWGQHFRTLWEYDGNKGKKTKILPPPPQKEKNWTVHECMLSLLIA